MRFRGLQAQMDTFGEYGRASLPERRSLISFNEAKSCEQHIEALGNRNELRWYPDDARYILMPREDTSLLEAALVGYQQRLNDIEQAMADIRSKLKRKGMTSRGTFPAIKQQRRKKRVLSPEARKRIGAAQKKRWAEYKRKQARGGLTNP